jgi:large subunit ribosomal protein L24
MSIAKIQTGDSVRIIAGNYKGTEGVVTEVITVTKGKKTIKRVVVSTIPTIVKYQKSNALAQVPGQMLQTSRKIDITNVMLVENGKTQRSKIVIKDNKKVREGLKTGNVVIKTNLAVDKELKKELTASKNK